MIVMENAYISLSFVNKGGESSVIALSSGGFIISGAVHLQAPAVLIDVNSEGSMMNARP